MGTGNRREWGVHVVLFYDDGSMYQCSSNAPLTQGIISAPDASRAGLHPNLIPGSHLILSFIHPSNCKHHNMSDDKGLVAIPSRQVSGSGGSGS